MGEPSSNAPDILAFVDEAGERGFVRDLSPERDDLVSVLCAIPVPSEHLDCLRDELRPLYDRFKEAAPGGAKLHITDAFKPGNEEWRTVAEQVRKELFSKMHEMQVILIYVARRCRVARQMFETMDDARQQMMSKRRSSVKIVGANRPSDEKIEDDLMKSLALMLDAFAEDASRQHVDIFFDEIDTEVAKRYESSLGSTRHISGSVSLVRGWDSRTKEKVEGQVAISVETPIRLDSKFLGTISVVGKDDPLIFAVDIVANSLWRHLSSLATNTALNNRTSVTGWDLENLVWAKDAPNNFDLF